MKLIITLILFVLLVPSAYAGAGGEAVLTGIYESGRTKLNISIWDISDQVLKAELIVDNDTIYFQSDCDVYKIIDPANHVFVLYFQQKGTNADSAMAKTLQIWALPNGFECNSAGSISSKFRAKIIATDPRDLNGQYLRPKLNCSFVWSP